MRAETFESSLASVSEQSRQIPRLGYRCGRMSSCTCRFSRPFPGGAVYIVQVPSVIGRVVGPSVLHEMKKFLCRCIIRSLKSASTRQKLLTMIPIGCGFHEIMFCRNSCLTAVSNLCFSPGIKESNDLPKNELIVSLNWHY